jgi:cytochrome P450
MALAQEGSSMSTTPPSIAPRRCAPASLSPFTPEFYALKNPYPLLHELRAFAPICWIEDAQSWAVTGYRLAADVLNNRSLRSHLDPGDGFDPASARPFIRALRWGMALSSRGERHAQLRQLFTGLMSPQGVAQLRKGIDQTVNRLIDQAECRKRIDIVKDFGYIIPFEQISQALCIPEEIHAQALGWMEQIFAGLKDFTYGLNDEAVLQAADDAISAVNNAFANLIAERRRAPRDDILDRMIKIADKNGTSDEELCVNAWSLYIAGLESTGTAIGYGVMRLFQHPDSLEKLRNQSALMPSAVEEILRYDVPFFVTARHGDEDLVVGDQLVKAGERMTIFLGAANHDPAQFPDPDRFDITRKPARALTFGIGPHLCVGQLLARLIMEAAYSVLLNRLPTFRLDDPDPPRTPMLAGLATLPGSW